MSNKTYTAANARKDAEENKDFRPQRAWVMGAIEREAKQGYTQLVVDVGTYGFTLNPDDWDWLESLGYTVTRPEMKVVVPYGQFPTGYNQHIMYYSGTVSW